MNCIECHEKPADFAPRVFRDKRTGVVIKGGRTFCSDGCENTFLERSREQNPESFDHYESL